LEKQGRFGERIVFGGCRRRVKKKKERKEVQRNLKLGHLEKDKNDERKGGAG